MQNLRKVDRWLCLRFRRYKFRRICKALKIKPYKWQKKVALAPADGIVEFWLYDKGRAEGKTTAIMLQLLMQHPHEPFNTRMILDGDPDFDVCRIRWYEQEWKRLQKTCMDAGIPVLDDTLWHLFGHLCGHP